MFRCPYVITYVVFQYVFALYFQFTTGECKMYTVKGRHVSFILEESAGEVARTINEIIVSSS